MGTSSKIAWQFMGVIVLIGTFLAAGLAVIEHSAKVHRDQMRVCEAQGHSHYDCTQVARYW